jgi:hypothetical protein
MFSRTCSYPRNIHASAARCRAARVGNPATEAANIVVGAFMSF